MKPPLMDASLRYEIKTSEALAHHVFELYVRVDRPSALQVDPQGYVGFALTDHLVIQPSFADVRADLLKLTQEHAARSVATILRTRVDSDPNAGRWRLSGDILKGYLGDRGPVRIRDALSGRAVELADAYRRCVELATMIPRAEIIGRFGRVSGALGDSDWSSR